MTTTANLLIPVLEVGQGGAEAIINQGLIALDLAVAGYLSKSVAGSADVTLTDTYNGEAKNSTLKLTGVLTGNIALILPALPRHYLMHNATSGAFTLTAKTASGAGVAVTQGGKAILYCDGLDTFQVVSTASGDASTDTSSSVDSEVALFSGTAGKTLKRASATGLAVLASGVLSTVTAPSGAVVGTSDTQSLTNKAIQPRVVAVSDATSFAPNADTTDILTQANTQATGTLTVGAPSGTPYNGQKMEWLLKCTNVQTLALNAIYRGSTDLALPTVTTGGSKKDRILWQYDSADTKWDFLAKVFGF